jgi:hypothetical protein
VESRAEFMAEDYYQTLGVPRTASAEDIRHTAPPAV